MRGIILTLTWLLALAACTTVPDVDAKAKGKLTGKLVLAYDNSDRRFIFLPVENDPLTYVTESGRAISPTKMYTDGGSIPRFFWSVKGLSPWAYGPAYAIHDYLFNQHRCAKRNPGSPDSDFRIQEANDFLYDAMLIVEQNVREDANREQRPPTADEAFASKQSRLLVKAAVDKFSRGAWDSEECLKPPEDKYVVTRVTNTPRTLNDKGAKILFSLPKQALGERTVKRLVPPVEIMTFSFD